MGVSGSVPELGHVGPPEVRPHLALQLAEDPGEAVAILAPSAGQDWHFTGDESGETPAKAKGPSANRIGGPTVLAK